MIPCSLSELRGHQLHRTRIRMSRPDLARGDEKIRRMLGRKPDEFGNPSHRLSCWRGKSHDSENSVCPWCRSRCEITRRIERFARLANSVREYASFRLHNNECMIRSSFKLGSAICKLLSGKYRGMMLREQSLLDLLARLRRKARNSITEPSQPIHARSKDGSESKCSRSFS